MQSNLKCKMEFTLKMASLYTPKGRGRALKTCVVFAFPPTVYLYGRGRYGGTAPAAEAGSLIMVQYNPHTLSALVRSK